MRSGDEAEAEYHSPMSEADNYIIEFTQIGGSVKVTAVDPRTMTEVSIVGGPQYSQEFLTRAGGQETGIRAVQAGRKGQ